MTTSSGSRTYNLLSGFSILAVTAVLGIRFFGMIQKYSVDVLYSDQWDFLKPFFVNQTGIVRLFLRQHGPHREGIGLLPDKFLYPLTHWNSRVDSFVIGIVIFSAMLLALLLKRKLYGPFEYSDVAIPVIFLSLAQYEILLSAPNPAHSAFPLLLIMLYCLALLCRNRLLRYAFVLALNFFLIYTGFGIVMGAITFGVFLLECYWSGRRFTSVPLAYPIAGFAVAAASFASFFIHYRVLPRMGCFDSPHIPWLRYPKFVAVMFSAAVVPNHRFPSLIALLGIIMLLAVGGLFALYSLRLLTPVHSDANLIGAVLLGYCLLLTTATAIGRVCLGMEEAYRSRRYTLLIPAFLAVYFYLYSKSWRGKRGLVLALFVLFFLPATLLKPTVTIRDLAARKRAWAACYLRNHNIHDCDQQTNFVLYPSPERNGMQQKLDYLQQYHLNFFYDAERK
ncbi:MAG TPA: hypothetical protein VMU61_03160 [Candidatus Aquilonibacter sp.]|nr:hypothetical protein [Candidatus Aquilonibacter sp.]